MPGRYNSRYFLGRAANRPAGGGPGNGPGNGNGNGNGGNGNNGNNGGGRPGGGGLPALPTPSNPAQVVGLLHFDGTNGATTTVDSSPSPKTVVMTNGAALSTAQVKFGTASCFFDQSDDKVEITTGAIGSANFWHEGWIYLTNVSGNKTVFCDTSAQGLAVRNAALVYVDDTTTVRITHQTAITINTWHHVAYTRGAANSLVIFLDGIVSNTSYTENTSLPSSSCNIGRTNFNSDPFGGYVDEVRLITGQSLTSSNFTSPTGPY